MFVSNATVVTTLTDEAVIGFCGVLWTDILDIENHVNVLNVTKSVYFNFSNG